MNIGIDLDDTITNTFEHKLALAYKYDIEKLGGNNLINPLERWTDKMFKWTKKNDFNFLKEVYINELKNVKPRIFAKETINKLYDEGNNVYIITARSDYYFGNAYLESKKYLDKNEIKYTDIITNIDEKEKICMEYKIDIFIDDSEKHCLNVSKTNTKAIIFSTMKNLNSAIDENKIIRVYCWPQIYDIICNNNLECLK